MLRARQKKGRDLEEGKREWSSELMFDSAQCSKFDDSGLLCEDSEENAGSPASLSLVPPSSLLPYRPYPTHRASV